jgi:LysM repeat protein
MSRLRRSAALVVAATTLVGLAGCGVLSDSGAPKSAGTTTLPTVFRTIPTVPGFGVTTTVAGTATSGAAVATGPVADSGTTYTVKAGDALGSIAAKTGVSYAQLLALNGFVEGKVVIHPGQVLKLPAKLPPTTTTTFPLGTVGTYTVKAGDALAGIAAKLKVNFADLLTVNKMPAGGSPITPGMKLAIPCRCKGATPFTG